MKKTRMKALLLGCICAVTTALSAVPASAATVVAGGSSATNDPALTAAPGTYTEQQSGGTSVDKPSAPPTVWVVGDSTAAAFNDTTYYSPRYGWGTQLGLYLQGVNIRNLAISGTSSKSYSDTDQYQTLLQNIRTSLNNLEDLMDDLDDKTGSEWLYISELQNDLSNMKKDLKNIQDDMKELSSRIKDLNAMNNAINGAMASVLDKLYDDGNGVISAKMYQSMAQLLSTLSSRCKALTDTLEGAASNLSATAKSLSGLLGTTDSILDNLDDICDVLDDYKGLGQDFTAEGKKLTELANTTLGRVNQQLTEIPALTESLNQLTSTTSSSIDKGTELIDTTTKTLTASHQLLDTVNSTLRSVRSDADASTQTTLDGLLDVLDKASRSNSSNKLQNATDDIHNAIDNAKTDLEDDTNILNIDSSADLQSVTSSMNPTPSSLQFILRTQEISTDDDDDAITSDQDAADEGVLARIVNIFKKLASAIYGVFASEE